MRFHVPVPPRQLRMVQANYAMLCLTLDNLPTYQLSHHLCRWLTLAASCLSFRPTANHLCWHSKPARSKQALSYRSVPPSHSLVLLMGPPASHLLYLEFRWFYGLFSNILNILVVTKFPLVCLVVTACPHPTTTALALASHLDTSIAPSQVAWLSDHSHLNPAQHVLQCLLTVSSQADFQVP